MKVPRAIRKVLIISNISKNDALETARIIEQFFQSLGIKTVVKTYAGNNLSVSLDDIKGSDLAVSLGGDGTALSAARLLVDHKLPIMAINLGTFGFITETGRDDWEESFYLFREGKLTDCERIMLKVDVKREGREVATFKGLNDGVISADRLSKLIALSVSCNDDSIGDYRADGVIISTPTGSTAYSLSAGGPILSPDMEALIINPVCPFTLSHRPLVVPGNKQICVKVKGKQSTQVNLSIDGQVNTPLLENDEVIFSQYPTKVSILNSHIRNYYDVIRSKLGWSGGVNA